MADGVVEGAPSREQLIHSLYEAAELEHNLMCTYLYAAFSLKSADEGLSEIEADAVGRWRRQITQVAIEEMGHLAAVWNITAALGGQPRFGRPNFPLDVGYLPAGIVVKRAVQRGCSPALRPSRTSNRVAGAGRRGICAGADFHTRHGPARAADAHAGRL